jgi:hypothetical protein
MPVPAWRSQPIVTASIFCLVVELTSSPSYAQTQQPFLFASDAANGKVTDIAVFTRNDSEFAANDESRRNGRSGGADRRSTGDWFDGFRHCRTNGTVQFPSDVGKRFQRDGHFCVPWAPLNARCTAPASVAVTSGTASSVMVTVTTSASALGMPGFPRGRLPEAYIILSIVSALALFLTSSRAQERRFRRPFGAAAAATVLVVVGNFGGCSSGSQQRPRPRPRGFIRSRLRRRRPHQAIPSSNFRWARSRSL